MAQLASSFCVFCFIHTRYDFNPIFSLLSSSKKIVLFDYHVVCIYVYVTHPLLNFWTGRPIFKKFGMRVMPLEANFIFFYFLTISNDKVGHTDLAGGSDTSAT